MTREQGTVVATWSVGDGRGRLWRRALAGGVSIAVGAAGLGCTGEVVEEPIEEPVAEVTQPIQGGAIDATTLAVVGIGVMNGDGRITKSCSGTLIAPNLVLTAQHCVASTNKSVRCGTATFGQPVDPGRVLVTTDTWMWNEGTTWFGAHSVEIPPGFPAVCGRDVALIILERPMLITPMTPRLNGQIESGQVYDAVGYGRTSDDASDGGARRRRNGLTIQCVATECGQSQVAGDEWRGNHGICSGDSGGPAIDEQGLIIGVTSRGPSGCDDPIYGGLGAWGGWMITVAQDAAAYGGYQMADWNSGVASSALSSRSFSGSGACAYAAAPGSSGGALGILLALGVLGLTRSRLRARQSC